MSGTALDERLYPELIGWAHHICSALLSWLGLYMVWLFHYYDNSVMNFREHTFLSTLA